MWIVRAAWTALAVVPSPIGDALADNGRTAQIVFTAAAWVVWAIGVGASAWLSPLSLTAIRSLAPMGLVGLIIATLARPDLADAAVLWPLASIALVVLANTAAFLPDYAATHVQASAYGAERRLPLRVPVPQIAPIALTWLCSFGALTGFLFSLGSRTWWLAVIMSPLACGLTWLAASRFHRFSRRWLVVVPAGIVVHDHLLLAETFMVKSHTVTDVRLADQPGDALDLSGVARGSLVVVSLRNAENLALSPYLARMLGTSAALHVRRYAIAPALTGQALAALTKPPATT